MDRAYNIMIKGGNMATKSNSKNKKGLLLIIAVVLVIVIAAVVIGLYFGAPDIFEKGLNFITGNGDPSTPDSGGSGEGLPPVVITEGELQIHMIDVGQGDCILILFPDGKEMLIDCANYNNSGDIREEALAYIDTYVTDGQIDYLMLTHCDSDHVYFMDEVLTEYDVDNIYMPNVLATHSSVAEANLDEEKLAWFTDPDDVDTKCYADFFIAALTEPEANIRLNIGDFTLEGEGWQIDFFCYDQEDWDDTRLNNAEAKNAISPIGILFYNGKKVVLTGDSNEINEPEFIAKAKAKYGVETLDCDVLKVGHHGSETSSTESFLNFIEVEYCFISCNADGNKFEHPRQATLDRFIARGVMIYRTDLMGNIVISIKDTEITFITEKDATQAQAQVGADTAAEQGQA